MVPQHYPELGNWVHQQRTHYKLMKQGRKTLMTREKALQLAEIQFQFQVKPRKQDPDDEGVKERSAQRAAQRAAALSQRASHEVCQQQGEHGSTLGGEEGSTETPIAMEQLGQIEPPPQHQARADQHAASAPEQHGEENVAV